MVDDGIEAEREFGAEPVLDSGEIIEQLPAPRDDEPPSLRRDIADEILDHLHVALRRELLVRGGDEDLAWKRVLVRFGDPRQVARRLWFQAMWSKIMTQRLVVVSALVSMTLSVVLTAMVASMIHGQQQTNAALVEQMSKLVLQQKPSPAPERDPRWNNLKIKVTLGSKTGPAAEGLDVTIIKLPDIGDVISEETENNAAPKTTVTRKKHQAKTNAQGVVDCGFVSPGRYELEVDSLTSESFSSTFTIYPGRDHVEEIVAPAKPPELTDVSFHLDGLPEDLDSKKHGLILSFHQIDDRKIDGQQWWASSWFPFGSTPFVMIIPERGVWITHIPPGGDGTLRYPPAIFYPQKGKGVQWQHLEQPYRFQIPAHQYSVCFDFVRVPSDMSPDDPEWYRNVLHDWNDSKIEWTKGNPTITSDPIVIKLLAEPGKLNDWTIKMPTPLLDAWRRRESASQERELQTIDRANRIRQLTAFDSNDFRSLRPRRPNLANELKADYSLAGQLKLTSNQKLELDRLYSRQVNALNTFDLHSSNSDSIVRIKERIAKLDDEATESLTREQMGLWEERLAELMREQFDADLKTLKKDEDGAISRLRVEANLSRAQLTEEQTQKLKEVEGQLDAERRTFLEANTQSQPDERQTKWLMKFHEFDKQFAECLKEEQKLLLIPRTPFTRRGPR